MRRSFAWEGERAFFFAFLAEIPGVRYNMDIEEEGDASMPVPCRLREKLRLLVRIAGGKP